jgi:DNA polymerase IV
MIIIMWLIATMAFALPSTYLLSAHLSLEALHDLEDRIPTITYDIAEAKLVLGKVTTKQRALFELRCRKLWTEEVLPEKSEVGDIGLCGEKTASTPARKRRKTDDTKVVEVSEVNLRTKYETETDDLAESPIIRLSQESRQSQDRSSPPAPVMSSPLSTEPFVPAVTSTQPQLAVEWGDTIKVVKLDWFTDCLAAGHLLPLGSYLVYEGRPAPTPRAISAEPKIMKVHSPILHDVTPHEVLLYISLQ